MLTCGVKRLYCEALLLGVGAMSADCRVRTAEAPAVTVGKKAPRCASVVSWAWRSAAWAALRSGLAFSAWAIRSFSGWEWNRVHQSPGRSVSPTNRCAAPAAIAGTDAVAGSGRAA